VDDGVTVLKAHRRKRLDDTRREREKERERKGSERGTVPNDAVKSNSRAIINCGQI